MKSKSKIEKQIRRKNNPLLVETVRLAKKNDAWLEVAGILSGSKKNRVNLNLRDIEEGSKENDCIVVSGKVLSEGNVSKKIKVVALSFSERAKEKLLKQKCEVLSIIEEIKKNPSAKGIKILRK